MLKRKREVELEAELLEYDQKIQRVEAMEKVYFEEEGKIKNEKKQGGLEGKEESKSREKKKKRKNKGYLNEEQN